MPLRHILNRVLAAGCLSAATLAPMAAFAAPTPALSTPAVPAVPAPAAGAAKVVPAAPSAPAAAASTATGSAVFPSAVSPQYSKLSAGQARMKTCLDQYHANKASGGNGGLKWIQKGGGYYSQCNAKLKG